MSDIRRGSGRWRVASVLLLGAGVLTGGASAGDDGPPALEGPAARGDLLPEGDAARPSNGNGPRHEAFRPPGTSPDRVRAPKSPPPPIVERPTDARPNDQAQWVSGYWTWDPSIQDFAWVAGAWRVPPSDAIWVNGRWQRDADGWSRVPGFWSPRRAPAVDGPALTPATPTTPANATTAPAVDWRTTGPPAAQPADDPGKAPDADAFHVPGHYAPEGSRVVWKAGFWARVQPGWDWLPARWVRRPSGWDYREGTWVRDPDAAVRQTRHTVARPSADGPALPPAIVESEPARSDAAPPAVDPPATTPPSRDLIAEAEDAARARDAQAQVPPVVLIPRAGAYPYPNPYASPYPYAYPGPYGYYGPASPRAYIPFGLMPPFARRVLNRVLP